MFESAFNVVLAIDGVRRDRPTFVFPDADRQSMASDFGPIAVGVKSGRTWCYLYR